MEDEIKLMNEMEGARIIEYLILTIKHKKSENAKHFVNSERVDDFSGLTICQYENDSGFQLFYCNNKWEVITDTWHESIEAAKNQASFEYEDLQIDWRKK